MISWGTSMVNNLVSGVTQTIGVGGEAWRTAFLSSNLSSFGVDFLRTHHFGFDIAARACSIEEDLHHHSQWKQLALCSVLDCVY
ncbi:hypothetical protein F2Q70_00039679 [Brassica cretica]|uniref:Uncharacterized protein n=1 Tax=Brassica cretica TaxID=69181 RepID=A0A8S9K501_BRACR|nr:hypothetical protein F2Q70_00039679 [Brassica cretica]